MSPDKRGRKNHNSPGFGMNMGLRASRDALIALIDAAPLAIFCHAQDGSIQLWNKAAERIFGWRAEEVVGGPNPIVPPEKQGEFRSIWNRVTQGERLSGMELRRCRKDGSAIDISLSPAPIFDAEGKLTGIMSIIEDISDRKRMEEALRDSEERFRTIFEKAAAGMVTISPEGRLFQANPAFCRYTGYEVGELQHMVMEDLIHPEDLANLRSLFEEVRGGRKASFDLELRLMGKNRSTVWGYMTTSWLFDAAGRPSYGIAMVQDITDRKNAAERQNEQLHFLQSLIDAIPNPIFYKDTDGRYVGCNRQLEEALGISQDQVIGRTVHEVAPPERAGICHSEDLALFATGQVRTYETRMTFADGSPREVMFSKAPLLDQDGNVSGLVGTIIDITELKQKESEIRRLAYFDHLTGLPNRALLKDRFEQVLMQASRNGHKAAVFYLDLDRFKAVNDTHGHSAGDRLLNEVARRLQETLRSTDTVSRMGGDEFVVVLPSIRHVEIVSAIASKVMEVFSAPYLLNGHEIFSTASMGIAIYPEDGQDVENLLRNADTAMYAAKERGRNHFQFFSPEMNSKAVDRLFLESRLRRAVEKEDFILHFQPQVNLENDVVTGLEALLRWQHADLGLVPPGKFIPIAEEAGLITPITQWVLKTACRQTKRWQDMGYSKLRVAVNMSGSLLKQGNLVQMIDEILSESGLRPEFLEIELTETVLMDNAESAAQVLRELKGIGISLALDDFGTGYSSLSCLKSFPIDRLKIDQSFVREILNTEDAAIAKAIIAMAESLGMGVVAEGIERSEQLEFLQANRCKEMQGFYFSRPVSSEEIDEILAHGLKVGEARLFPISSSGD